MNAESFVRCFLPKTRSLTADSMDKPVWTKAMTEVLRKIGEAQKYHVRCHLSDGEKRWLPGDDGNEYIKRGEFLNVDVSYWSNLPNHSIPKTVNGATRRFHCHPLVCVEHENVRRLFAAQRDFNKVCLFAVPLRVFIGYGKTSEEAKEFGGKLTMFFKDVELRQNRQRPNSHYHEPPSEATD